MKVILTSELRRAKSSVLSIMESACDAKKVSPDNISSLVYVMKIFVNLLEKKHDIDHADVVKLYAFNQGELDELS